MNCDSNDVKQVLSLDPRDAIEIKGGNKIDVVVERTGTKDVYTVSYKEYAPPTITVAHTGPGNLVVKVGTTVTTATFAGAINTGTEDIVERTMTPDKSLSLTAPISYQETNILGTSPGLWPQFSGVPTIITAKDAQGTTVTKQVGVEFRYPYYMLYTTQEIIANDDAILGSATEDLLTSILGKYSSFVYNYSTLPVYIYWLFPVGSTTFTSAQEGAQNVPLKLDCSPITITLTGVITPVTYRVIRTAVKTRFTSVTPITLH